MTVRVDEAIRAYQEWNELYDKASSALDVWTGLTRLFTDEESHEFGERLKRLSRK